MPTTYDDTKATQKLRQLTSAARLVPSFLAKARKTPKKRVLFNMDGTYGLNNEKKLKP